MLPVSTDVLGANRLRHHASLLATCVLMLLLGVTACKTKKGETQAPLLPPPTRTEDQRPDRPAPEPAGPRLLLRGARVMTATGVSYPHGQVLIEGDRIAAVGVTLPEAEEAEVVELRGKVVTPGIIDTHSHLGVYASPGFSAHSDGNEIGSPITAEVWSADGVWPQDPQFERARAGGVTTMQILPGSANLIGGRSVTIKPYPGLRSLDDARFEGAPLGLKMACGENPKRVYGDKGGPSTRMGNMARYRKAFQEAIEYRRSWQRYHDRLARYEAKQHARRSGGKDERKGDEGESDEDNEAKDPPEPPARNESLESLVGVLNGDTYLHMHCYRADEMLLMMDLARHFGFRVRSFHHAVEAYKIADRLAERDVAASIWADWWGFKAEAYDGIRENAALLFAAGGRPIIHSDSPVGIQHLNQETAKAMYAGRRMGMTISDEDALRWMTANPAWALGIDGEVGTLEPGKVADIVVWSGDPFSVYSRVEQVYIEGELVYDHTWGPEQPRSDFEVGLRQGDAERPEAPAVFPPSSASQDDAR
ncbi:MAG: amidohydrolase [Myxococcota bacterium]